MMIQPCFSLVLVSFDFVYEQCTLAPNNILCIQSWDCPGKDSSLIQSSPLDCLHSFLYSILKSTIHHHLSVNMATSYNRCQQCWYVARWLLDSILDRILVYFLSFGHQSGGMSFSNYSHLVFSHYCNIHPCQSII